MSLEDLFQQHLAERRAAVEKDLDATGFESLVVSSGAPYVYFRDDTEAPFQSAGHFTHWCPLEGPHHLVKIEPGRKPLLVRYAPEDYWYEQQPLGEPFWLSQFELIEAATIDAAWEALDRPKHAAYVGNEIERALGADLEVNPDVLLSHLDWQRAYKTDYEIKCLDEASRIGAQGHKAAKTAFEAGASELEIYHVFLQAMEVTDRDLPYNTIIALDEKAATLHYEKKRKTRDGKVLLIDAAARVRGYAADITRTHVSKDCDARFVALRDGMVRAQQALCAAIRPGRLFGELHQLAQVKVATLLNDLEILRAEPEEAVELGLSRPFLPHGLGHHLGIQVHDVGGHLASPDGTLVPPPEKYPYLRNTRRIEPRQVFTVEPGLYFIPMLLRSFRAGEHRARFDWGLIDELTPLGGIRIEDNIVVTEAGHRNLTRAYLP